MLSCQKVFSHSQMPIARFLFIKAAHALSCKGELCNSTSSVLWWVIGSVLSGTCVSQMDLSTGEQGRRSRRNKMCNMRCESTSVCTDKPILWCSRGASWQLLDDTDVICIWIDVHAPLPTCLKMNICLSSFRKWAEHRWGIQTVQQQVDLSRLWYRKLHSVFYLFYSIRVEKRVLTQCFCLCNIFILIIFFFFF